MTIPEILRSAHLPVTVPELRAVTGLTHEQVYQELVNMDSNGAARPVMYQHNGRRSVCTGWIAIN